MMMAGLSAAEPSEIMEPAAYLGRAPSFSAEKVAMVKDMLAAGHGVSAVAKETKLSRQAIDRVKDDPAWVEALVAKWAAKRRNAA
jgi:putative DNA-invertase from lambdoid prophage Rac